MKKLYCAYDHAIPKEKIANHKCGICGKLLCKICGYSDKGIDYCNECWEAKDKKVYCLYIKSHCETPDFEVEVVANSKEEALKLFRKHHGQALCEFDDYFLLSKIGVITR